MPKTKYRQAKIKMPKGQGMATAECPACLDRNRRGGQATFKSSDSQGRNSWWARHENHHIPKSEEYGLRG